jgi:hypothetical protein
MIFIEIIRWKLFGETTKSLSFFWEETNFKKNKEDTTLQRISVQNTISGINIPKGSPQSRCEHHQIHNRYAWHDFA